MLTGKYDLEILTLPRIFINNVQIDDDKTTHIEIPTPGILTMNKSYEYYGVLFMQEKGELKKIYDLKPALKQETIALQPGKYSIVYRAKFKALSHLHALTVARNYCSLHQQQSLRIALG